jgi:hypothetical protein
MVVPDRSTGPQGRQELVPRPFDLAARGHVLEAEAALAELVVADDEDPGGLELASPGEVDLHAAVLELDQTLDAAPPEKAGQLEPSFFSLLSEVG